MGNGHSEVIKDPLRLPPADRAKLVDTLYAGLGCSDTQAIEQAWVQEAELRLEALRAGNIGSEPWDDLKENLRKMQSRRSRIVHPRLSGSPYLAFGGPFGNVLKGIVAKLIFHEEKHFETFVFCF